MASFVIFNPDNKSYEIDDSKIANASSFSTRLLLYTLLQTRDYASGKLLDVGCGTKPYRSFFTVDHYFGIDWPQSSHDLEIDVFADAQVLPFASQSFDTVLCTEVIEHIPCPWEAIAETKRVLKPGGFLILTAPFIHWHHEAPNDHYRYTYYGLQNLVLQAGLIPIAIWQRGGSGSVLVDIISRIFAGWLRALLRRLHLPRNIQDTFLLLVQSPQRLIATSILHDTKRRVSTGSLEITPAAYSLGFTLIASRPGE
jgi:SAM-dependent methyltransferase